MSTSSTISGNGTNGFISFQSGVANYISTVDVEISSQNLGAWNNYLGGTYTTGFVYVARSPSSSEEFRGLLRYYYTSKSSSGNIKDLPSFGFLLVPVLLLPI